MSTEAPAARKRSDTYTSRDVRILIWTLGVLGFAVLLSVLSFNYLTTPSMQAAGGSFIPGPPAHFFALGPVNITYFAVFHLLGISAGIWLTSVRLTRRGGLPGAALDIATWAVIFGIVGGRLYHVVTHPGDYFYPGADLFKVFALWEGGIAIYGSIIFGALGAYVGCRRAGIRLLSFADALAPGLLIGQAIGRIGCYFAEELYGSPTTLPWGLQVTQMSPAFPSGLPADTIFHPLFLYELIWNLIGAAVIILVERKTTMRWGTAFGLYLVWYGTGRVWLEELRLDPSEFLLAGIKINMVASISAVILGLVIILVQTWRHPPLEPSVYRSGNDRGVIAMPSEELNHDQHHTVRNPRP